MERMRGAAGSLAWIDRTKPLALYVEQRGLQNTEACSTTRAAEQPALQRKEWNACVALLGLVAGIKLQLPRA